jgi:predicted transcriptional regulator
MVDDRAYNQLGSLTSSSTTEISRLSLMVKNLKDCVESLERNQTELMDKLNDLQKELDTEDDDSD